MSRTSLAGWDPTEWDRDGKTVGLYSHSLTSPAQKLNQRLANNNIQTYWPTPEHAWALMNTKMSDFCELRYKSALCDNAMQARVSPYYILLFPPAEYSLPIRDQQFLEPLLDQLGNTIVFAIDNPELWNDCCSAVTWEVGTGRCEQTYKLYNIMRGLVRTNIHDILSPINVTSNAVHPTYILDVKNEGQNGPTLKAYSPVDHMMANTMNLVSASS